MNTAITQSDVRPPQRSRWRSALAYQIYCEFVKPVRAPIFLFSLFVLPIMLFALFVLPDIDDTQNGVSVGRYALATFTIYIVMMSGVFSTAISIANERARRWNVLLRATPMRVSDYFTAKIVTSLVIGALAVIALSVFARIAGDVSFSLTEWPELIGAALVSMVPFIAIGLFIGYAVGSQTAPAIANLIVLPLAFLSGIFQPYDDLPGFAKTIAPYSPAYHASRLTLRVAGVSDDRSIAVHIAWLAGYTLLFVLLARRFYRRDEGKAMG
jgi:ABC-2 type transport system permease protein